MRRMCVKRQTDLRKSMRKYHFCGKTTTTTSKRTTLHTFLHCGTSLAVLQIASVVSGGVFLSQNVIAWQIFRKQCVPPQRCKATMTEQSIVAPIPRGHQGTVIYTRQVFNRTQSETHQMLQHVIKREMVFQSAKMIATLWNNTKTKGFRFDHDANVYCAVARSRLGKL